MPDSPVSAQGHSYLAKVRGGSPEKGTVGPEALRTEE